MRAFPLLLVHAVGLMASVVLPSVAIGQESASPLYVSASRLAVRTGPSSDSKIKGYLPTNSSVSVKSRADDWCEVTGQFTEGSDLQAGYVACSYLVKSKLRLEELQKQSGDTALTGKEHLDALQKEFWISPSLDKLMSYGEALDKEHPHPETVDVQPKKARRQEFEAMKNFLRAGWSPASFEYLPIDAKLEPANYRLLPLPQVQRSLFEATAPHLILAPYIGKKQWKDHSDRTTVFMARASQFAQEALSRQSIKLVRITSISGPLAGHYGGFKAAWDVGGLTLKFDSPGLPILAFPADGTGFRNAILGVSTEGVQFDAECDQIGETIALAKPVSNADSAKGVLAFIVNPEQAGITSFKRLVRKTRALSEEDAIELHQAITSRDVAPESGDSIAGYRAFTTVFDLNDDGVPDIAFGGIEGGPNSSILSTGPQIDRVFVAFLNMDGKWVKHSYFSPLRCGS